MKVSDFMMANVVTCHPDSWLTEAAKLMREHEIGFLPVVDRKTGVLVGVLTDRDGFMAAFAEGKRLWDIPVRAAMNREVKSCKADAPIEEAEQIMGTNRIRRLPVVDEANHPIGLLSLDDIARRAALEGNEAIELEVAAALGAISRAREGLAFRH